MPGPIKSVRPARIRSDAALLKEALGPLLLHQSAPSEQFDACMRLMTIGQLAAGVAHELNNPLSVILGFTQSLSHQLADQSAYASSFEMIERETLRCRRLVQELLNFSRRPRQELIQEDLIQVLESALTLVEAQTRIQGVGLVRRFPQSVPRIYMDPFRIQQLITNLCINALDAMAEKGGTLTIAVRESTAKARQSAGLELQVSDTGIGIPESIREDIFKPFFSTKESGRGTGLGLYLVKNIVKFHRGRLSLTSVPGQGTTFTIWLPLSKDPGPGRPGEPSNNARS